MRTSVLGLPVDILNREATIKRVVDWVKAPISRPRMVVTAYSEFFVTARGDKDFANVIKKADLVTPDGISVLAAVDYKKRVSSWYRSNGWKRLYQHLVAGVETGRRILSAELGETVTGVWLFERLTKESSKREWKIFLLGGWGGVSLRASTMLLERFPQLKVAYDEGEYSVGTDPNEDLRIVKKINAFKPDILFVQYSPVKQEKWIASHLTTLKCRLAIGVGGTFNEFLGEFPKAPVWMERMGLKWLWRLWVEPRRWRRMVKAVIVFPWLVFVESIKKRPSLEDGRVWTA